MNRKWGLVPCRHLGMNLGNEIVNMWNKAGTITKPASATIQNYYHCDLYVNRYVTTPEA